MITKAIVRKPGRNFADGLTSSGLGKPDFEKALKQHSYYCEALMSLGLELIVLDADERYPDGCFVEDTAVITSEIAIITRPGAGSRQGEEVIIKSVLSELKKTVSIEAPGTLDGGDIMRAENHFYIGMSDRTNNEGAGQLSEVLQQYGYTSSLIKVGEGLHLKSGIAYLGHGNFITAKVPEGLIEYKEIIITGDADSYSANCLHVNEKLLLSSGFPKIKEQVIRLGYKVIELDMSEFRKMDGGLTCLSLLL